MSATRKCVGIRSALDTPVGGDRHTVAKTAEQAPHRLVQRFAADIPSGDLDGAGGARLQPRWQPPNADTKQSRIERLGVHRVLRSEEHTSELQSRGHLVCRL